MKTGGWIASECPLVNPTLKVIRRNDPDYGLSEEEIMDRNEFIRCYLRQEHEALLMVPKQEPASDFFIADFEDSAFNTHDFEQICRPFNRFAYAVEKVLEQVKELAIMHSSISSEEGRLNTQKRSETVVDSAFRDRLLSLSRRMWQHWRTDLRAK